MNDEAALMRAIIAEPADDLARLVYCDWLEEFGDNPLRAAAIRDEIARPELDRRWAGWAGWARGTSAELTHHRGFVAEIKCTMAFWLANGPDWQANQPLEVVRVTDREPAGADAIERDGRVAFWRTYGPLLPFMTPDSVSAWFFPDCDWSWADDIFGDRSQSSLPSAVFAKLNSSNRSSVMRFYATRELALADRSQACLAWAKSVNEARASHREAVG